MAAARDLLDSLSRPPGQTWRDTLAHHGARAALLVALVLLVQLLFPVAPVPDYPVLEKGMIPQADIIAEVAFPIPKSDADLASEQADAAAAVAPVFRYSAGAADSMLAQVRTFVAGLDTAATGASAAEARTRLAALLQSYGLPATAESLTLLEDANNRRSLLSSLESTITTELPRGIVSQADAEDSQTPQWRIVRDSGEVLVDRDSIRTQSWFFEQARSHLPQESAAGLADLQRLVLILFFDGSLKLDRDATTAAREQARQAVPTIKEQVLRGQRIVAAHEPIGDAEIERMRAYQSYMREAGALGTGSATYMRAAGSVMLHTLLFGMLGLLLVFYRPALYADFRHMSVMAFLTAILLGSSAVIADAQAPIELIPIAFPVLVIAMLWDGRLALIFAIVTAALLSTLTPFMSLSARMLPLLAAATAALSVRVVQRRSQGLVLGAIVAAAYAAGCIALGLMRTQEASEVMQGILWGSVNGVASALIAMGFLPLFEAYTRITTDQTLLEMADLNRPILKRLSLEASGTYAHSINVANLAEAAARAIGANPLLARVGAYYHDIGKIATPQYFIENQARGRNPHEQMNPHHSASLVRRHVEDGLRLAAEARLPESVRAFIPEHHGTQLIGYFYDQARKLDPDTEPDPADFAYPGPRPRSAETAILMLADSVESATKVLPDPSVERIRELVDRIADGKIAQGQFDDAPITLRDLRRIKDQLTLTLAGIYHHRIDYPAAAINPTLDSAPDGETETPEDKGVGS
jgi:putative nucleotidyltransferase with HDIG domain